MLTEGKIEQEPFPTRTMHPHHCQPKRNRNCSSRSPRQRVASTFVLLTFLISSCEAGTLPSISAVSTAAAAAAQAASQIAREDDGNNDAVDSMLETVAQQATEDVATNDDSETISTTSVGNVNTTAGDSIINGVDGEGEIDVDVGVDNIEAIVEEEEEEEDDDHEEETPAGLSTLTNTTRDEISLEPTSFLTEIASERPSSEAPTAVALTQEPTSFFDTDLPTHSASEFSTKSPSISPVEAEPLVEGDSDDLVFANSTANISNIMNTEEEHDEDDKTEQAFTSNATSSNTTTTAEDTIDEAGSGSLPTNVSDTPGIEDSDEEADRSRGNSTSHNTTGTFPTVPDSGEDDESNKNVEPEPKPEEDIILEEDPYPFLVSRDTSLCAYEVAGVLKCNAWRGFCTGDCEFNSYQNGSGCHVTQRMPPTVEDPVEPAGCGCDNTEICICHHPTHKIKYHIGRECHSHMRVDSGEQAIIFPGVLNVDDEEESTNKSGGSGRRKLARMARRKWLRSTGSNNLRRRKV